jgi:hypothetical protein
LGGRSGFTILALKKKAHIIQQLCLGLRNFVYFRMLYFLQVYQRPTFLYQTYGIPQSKKSTCLILEEVEMARSQASVASQQQQRVDKINTTNDKTSASNENQDEIQFSLMTKFRILSADL